MSVRQNKNMPLYKLEGENGEIRKEDEDGEGGQEGWGGRCVCVSRSVL